VAEDRLTASKIIDDIKVAKSSSALRYDEGKLRVDLVPPQWVEWLAEVFTIGAKKYAEHNWKKGMKFSRMQGSMMRHLLKWQKGEKTDEESGLHPLLHVAWNALALVYYEKHWMPEWDDREFKESNLPTGQEIEDRQLVGGVIKYPTISPCIWCRSNPCICSQLLGLVCSTCELIPCTCIWGPYYE